MARRNVLAAVALLVACNSKGDEAKPSAGGIDLGKRCDQLAKLCGDKDKHVDKILSECTAAAPAAMTKGCADKTAAVYDCYEKELCGKADKVWALDDLRVLAERKNKCAAERAAATQCVGK
jgi:hypothetical protein